jgi:hypothetical protein
MIDENETKLGRRQAMQVLGLGITAAGMIIARPESAFAAAPAKAAAKPAAAPLSCNDKAPIDATSKTMRSALQYKEKYDTAEKKCSSCLQYEAKKFGECGGCKLFTGAVAPDGVCLSYAPIAAAKP